METYSSTNINTIGNIVKDVANVEDSNVRASRKAGWSSKRGKGKYTLTIVLLVYCLMSLIPIVQSMAVSIDQLKLVLKEQLDTVTTNLKGEIGTVKVIFQSEISDLRSETDKKYSELADRITNIEQAAAKAMPTTYSKVASMPACVKEPNNIPLARVPLSKEEFNKEMEDAQQ